MQRLRKKPLTKPSISFQIYTSSVSSSSGKKDDKEKEHNAKLSHSIRLKFQLTNCVILQGILWLNLLKFNSHDEKVERFDHAFSNLDRCRTASI